MYIIVGKEAVEKLEGNYTILELETFQEASGPVTAYCVVDAEQIPIMEIPMISHQKAYHKSFIDEYNKGNYKFCLDAMEHLKGKFGGELDSFYDEIYQRITS